MGSVVFAGGLDRVSREPKFFDFGWKPRGSRCAGGVSVDRAWRVCICGDAVSGDGNRTRHHRISAQFRGGSGSHEYRGGGHSALALTPRASGYGGNGCRVFWRPAAHLFQCPGLHNRLARGLGLYDCPLHDVVDCSGFRNRETNPSEIHRDRRCDAGVVVALGQGAGAPPDAWIGDGLILIGALITAVFGVWSSRALQRHSPLVTVVAGVVPGSFLLFLFALATEAPTFKPDLSPISWAAMAYLGIGAAVISYTLWLWALRHTTPTLVSIALPVNPLMALFWGAILLGEDVTVEMLIGFALVICGIAIANWRRRAACEAAHVE